MNSENFDFSRTPPPCSIRREFRTPNQYNFPTAQTFNFNRPLLNHVPSLQMFNRGIQPFPLSSNGGSFMREPPPRALPQVILSQPPNLGRISHLCDSPRPFFPPSQFLYSQRSRPDFCYKHVENKNPQLVDVKHSDYNFTRPNSDSSCFVSKNVDEWLSNWEMKVKKKVTETNKNFKKTKYKLRISDVQNKMLEYSEFVIELNDLKNELEKYDEKDLGWEKLKFRAEEIIQKISNCKEFFRDKKEEVKEMVDKRRSKRIMSRKNRKIRVNKNNEIKQNWKIKEKEIDKWMEKIQKEEQDKLETEKIRKNADNVLKEVRIKQDDVKNMRKILNILTQLRNARIKKGETHGYVQNEEADVCFKKVKDEFDSLLTNQLEHYQIEERTLRSMMEEHQNFFPSQHQKNYSQNNQINTEVYNLSSGETSSGKSKKPLDINHYNLTKPLDINHHKPKRPLDINQHREACGSNDLKIALFGNQNVKEDQKEIYEFYTDSEKSRDILVQRRKEWDSYITEEESQSSSVPISWVFPNPKPNSEWKKYLNFNIEGKNI